MSEIDEVLTDEKGKIHRLIEWLHGDPLKIRRWVRGFIAWLAGILTQVLAAGIDAAVDWKWQDWVKRLGVAGLFGLVGLINLGDKNLPTPTPEEKK
jgi:hypothetical protein